MGHQGFPFREPRGVDEEKRLSADAAGARQGHQQAGQRCGRQKQFEPLHSASRRAACERCLRIIRRSGEARTVRHPQRFSGPHIGLKAEDQETPVSDLRRRPRAVCAL